MKKIVTISTLIAVLFAIACKKDPAEPMRKQHTKELTLNLLLGPESNPGDYIVHGASLRNYINQFTAIFYNEEGLEVHRETQYSGSPGFGTMTLTLPAGNYQVVAAASKASFGISTFDPAKLNSVILPYSDASFQYQQTGNKPSYKTDETFFRQSFFSVEDNEPAAFRLYRVVGKLEFSIADVKSYSVRILNEATGLSFKDEVPLGSLESEGGFTVNNSSGPIVLNILRTEKPLQIEITGDGKTRQLSVPIKRNQRTIVKGKLIEARIEGGLSFSPDAGVAPLDSFIVEL